MTLLIRCRTSVYMPRLESHRRALKGTCVRCPDRRRHRQPLRLPSSIHARANRIVRRQPDRIRSHATATEAPALAARHTIQPMLRLRELTSVAGSWTSSTSSERDEARFAAFSVTADRMTPAVRDTAPQRHRRLAPPTGTRITAASDSSPSRLRTRRSCNRPSGRHPTLTRAGRRE